MVREPDDRVGRDDDQIRFGPDRAAPRWVRSVLGASRWGWTRRPLARWLAAGVTAAIVAGGAVAVGTVGATPADSGGRWYDTTGPVAVERLGHPLLGEGEGEGEGDGDGQRGNWELLAVSAGSEPGARSAVLIRVQPAEGIVTATRFPGLDSEAPIALVTLPGETVIRSWDFVPGYLVPDGRAARRLPAAFGEGGYVFPGPRPGEVWVQDGSDPVPVLRLVTAAGASSGAAIRLPGNGLLAVPDGQGYVLVQEPDGVYDARPDGAREIAAGNLAASGREAWLISDCPRAGRCGNSVVDPVTGTRHVLPGASDYDRPTPYWPPGTVCADGTSAAMLRVGPRHTGTVRLVSLRTGAEHDISVGPVAESASLVWSPDSRWLFTIASNGAIEAIAVRTGRVRSLGVPLPPVSYLALG